MKLMFLLLLTLGCLYGQAQVIRDSAIMKKSQTEPTKTIRAKEELPKERRLPLRAAPLSVRDSIHLAINTIISTASLPNNETTWAPLRRKITDFLTLQWQQGKLHGVSTDQAFFVQAGTTTMTQADISSGKLVVSIGLALVKPAEFETHRFEKQLLHPKN